MSYARARHAATSVPRSDAGQLTVAPTSILSYTYLNEKHGASLKTVDQNQGPAIFRHGRQPRRMAMSGAGDLDLPPVAPGVMRWDADGRAVLLGRCDANTGVVLFPFDGSAADDTEVDLGGEGTLHAFTTIYAKPPFGLPSPYSVGYIDLEKVPTRVFCLVAGSAADGLRRGARVRVFARRLGTDADGAACLRPVFEVVRAKADCEATDDG